MARRCNPYLTLPMDFVDDEFMAEVTTDMRIQISQWLGEEDPHWRSMLRDHMRDDILWLRAWRAAYARNSTAQKEAA
jgi:hypothetical protein